jgi:hypothetical protein
VYYIAGADPGFQFRGRGGALKKLRLAEGVAKFFGVFRVENHDFTPKNHIFSNCGGRREIFEVFRVKNHDFTPKNHIFSNIRGGAPPTPPPGSAPALGVRSYGLGYRCLSLRSDSFQNYRDYRT